MKLLAAFAILVLVATASILSFSSTGRAEPGPAGPPCPAGVPLDLGQGYGDALAAPLAIPDLVPAGVEDCFTIPSQGAPTIDGLAVHVSITHTWVGDLRVVLTHVDTGTTVVLLDRPGVPQGTSCNADDVRATFIDAASETAESQCDTTPPAVSGSVRPNEALSVFDGELLAGTWRLTVSDLTIGDVGTLNAWALLPITAGADGDVNCSGNTDAIDAALLLQIAAGFNFILQCAEEGDVNANGSIDSIDAALVLQYAAGLIPVWPLPLLPL